MAFKCINAHDQIDHISYEYFLFPPSSFCELESTEQPCGHWTSSITCKHMMEEQYEDFHGSLAIESVLFQKIVTCMKACLSQPVEQSPGCRDRRCFQGCSFHHCWSSLTHAEDIACVAGSLNVPMVQNSYQYPSAPVQGWMPWFPKNTPRFPCSYATAASAVSSSEFLYLT